MAAIILESALFLIGHRFGHFGHHLDKPVHLALNEFLFHAPLGLFVNRVANEQFVGQGVELIVFAVHERLDFPATSPDFRQGFLGAFFTMRETDQGIDRHATNGDNREKEAWR